MKIRELNLIAYGAFRNRRLTFEGDRLQLIYGPNEAGKSTALRALQAVLYGMTEKRDAYLHPMDMMRVGMSIETADGMVNVERRKGKGVRSLQYTGIERSVSGEEWARVLPVQNLDLFIQMFGLDYQRLVEGGQQLAQGKGEIGEVMLAASGDLGGAMDQFRGFKRRAEEIYQGHARSKAALNTVLRAYKEANQQMRSERYSSNAYRNAVRELDQKRKECDELTARIHECATEQQRLNRLRQAAPMVTLLRSKQAELAEIASATLAEDFASRYQGAIGRWRTAQNAIENSDAELARLTERLSALQRDPALAGKKPAIDRLFAESGKIEAARTDRPKRQGQLRELEETARRNLRQLGLNRELAECVDLRVRLVQQSEVRRLAKERPEILARMEEAARQISELNESEADTMRALDQLPECVDTAEIERLLGALAALPATREVAKWSRQLATAEADFQRDLNALPLFTGDGEALRQLSVPLPATVRLYQGWFSEQQANEALRRNDVARIEQETAQLESDLRTLEQGGDVPTEVDLTAARERRQEGWSAVRSRWIDGSPDDAAEARILAAATSGTTLDRAYEEAVQGADHVADRLRSESGRVQKKTLLLERIAQAQSRAEEARRAVVEATDAGAALLQRWYDQWMPAGLDPLSPAEMLDWLDSRRAIAEKLRAASELRGQIQDTERRSSELLTALGNELGETSAANMAELAQRRVKTMSDTRTARRDGERELARIRKNRITAENRRDEFRERLTAWDRDWAVAIEGLPVPANATTDTVQQVIGLLDDVANAAEQIRDLRHRIDEMKADEDTFDASLQRIVESAEDVDPVVRIRQLHAAASTASKTEDTAARLEQDLERTRRTKDSSGQDLERAQQDLEALRKEAGVDATDDIPAAIERSDRRRGLVKSIEEQRSALAGACAGRSLEALMEEVGALDHDALPARLDDLERQQQSLDERRRQASHRAGELEHEFQTHEGSLMLSQAAAARQSAGARILELAEEYVEQELASRLMSAAIERYRTRCQDPLIESAGRFLSSLTLGSLSGLAVEYDDNNRRVLRAVRRTGEHVDIEGLSDGTRDQLFFALRLAYIENYAAQSGRCPVILDDVLMAFDDDRTTAALRVLSELAGKTQVLLFTHHAHHVQLAQSCLAAESLAVHELAGSSTTALVAD